MLPPPTTLMSDRVRYVQTGGRPHDAGALKTESLATRAGRLVEAHDAASRLRGRNATASISMMLPR